MTRRIDWFIPILLFVIFTAITLPGIGWGVPSYWHPDELARNVDKMVQGTYQVDGTYFNHPFLPKHVYYLIGKIIYGTGHSRSIYILAVRLSNVLLAAGMIALVYGISRRAGAGIAASAWAGAFALASSEFALNARIAHNDIYLGFFTTLAVYCLVQYRTRGAKAWLYGSFLTVGLAASSKYNGVSLGLAPLVVILLDHVSAKNKGLFDPLKTILIGGLLILLGFMLGTPEAISQLPFFAQSIFTSMFHHAEFNRQPDTLIGLIGQWRVLYTALGASAALLFLTAFMYDLAGILFKDRRSFTGSQSNRKAVEAVLISAIALDIPMLIVFNYPARFFLPMIPLLAVLAGIFFEQLLRRFMPRGWFVPAVVHAVAAGVFVLSLSRAASITLLYLNDARIEASEFIARLPPDTSIEYTFYPPTIPEKHFSHRQTYPLFFSKSMVGGEPDPDWSGQINLGELGLEKRATDYLIVDSFTYERFADPLLCQTIPSECVFFNRLLAGEAAYRLLAKFEYRLPEFLPQLSPFFLNPVIQVYQRGS